MLKFKSNHKPLTSAFLFVSLLCISTVLMAHHSVGGTYDETNYAEISGVLKDIKWRNPHVQLEVLVANENGSETVWMIEMASVSLMRRHGLKPGFMNVGEEIKVYGLMAWKGPHRMLGRNLLLQNKQEVILQAQGTAHWADESESSVKDLNSGRLGDGSSPELGIFRVWSLPTSQGGATFWNKEYPLTTEAQTSLANFDSKSEKLMVNCEAKGLPTVMAQPYPIEFIKDGDDIVLKLEEFDTVRPINMGEVNVASHQVESITGHSRGVWHNNTLIVTTTNISWPSFNGRGIPLGSNATLIERFTPTADGSRLNYTMTVIDPETFTVPVILSRFWYWYPDVTLAGYNCEY